MSNATLDGIEAALFAALGTLRTSAAPAGPFVLVERWAGEVTQELGVDQATLGKSPSALLAFEESVPLGPEGAYVETGGHALDVVERHLFRVYVTVTDARGDRAATQGTTGHAGVLACTHKVKKALTGLAVPGLFDGDVVRLVGHRPWFIKRGVSYTHVLRFSARAALDESTPTENPVPGTPLGGVRGDVLDATPDTDGAAVSLATFDHRF